MASAPMLEPLSVVLAQRDKEAPLTPFGGLLDGEHVVDVVAVLEKTCVYLDAKGVRTLANLGRMMVEADFLRWRRKGYAALSREESRIRGHINSRIQRYGN